MHLGRGYLYGGINRGTAARALALAGLILLAGAFGAIRDAVAATTVTDIRAGRHPDKIRLVLDLNGPVTFETFTLPDPYRVVVDLNEVKWAQSRPPRLGITEISNFRFGLFKPGTSRLVVDTTVPLAIAKTLLLAPTAKVKHHRLIIDLRRISQTRYRAEAMAALERRLQSRPPTTPAPPPSAAPLARTDKRKLIIIDPGHGGVDPGAIGQSGVYEKQIVLAMAHQLKKVLEASGDYRVKLTRRRDIFLRLRQRIAIARAAQGDLFISLHADSLNDPSHRGASVYTLSERASDKEAAQLAAKENKSDIIAGMDFSAETPEVANILIDLAQRETMNHSARFAGTLVNELARDIKTLRRSHRFAGFAVLKAPDIPSVLVELGYLSNATEERLLQDPGHRHKIARAIHRGIDRFFGTGTGLAKSLPRPRPTR